MLIRIFILLVTASLAAAAAMGQGTVPSTASACRLQGTDSVAGGSTASFALGPCTSSSWTVSNGVIVAQSPGSVTVRFTGSSAGTAVITASAGGQAVSKTVVVRTAPAFSGGAIAAASQALRIVAGKIPGAILADAATGGAGDGVFTYQWFTSTDGVAFSPVPGATAQNYQPGGLTATTWLKRMATSRTGDTVTTAPVTVMVYPSLAGTPLFPAVQAINHHGMAAVLSLAMPSTTLPVSYQWQRAYNASFSDATNIPGATTATYTPGTLDSTSYFRVLLIGGGDTAHSSPAVVAVYPLLDPGRLVPASQTVTTDSLPALLTCTGISGGNGNYLFQWYSSPDGTSWSPVGGVATQGYDPGALKATTWFRVVVTSNGISLAGTSAVINVNP